MIGSKDPIPLYNQIAVAAMVGCVVLSMVQVAQLLSPAWNGTYVVIGCVLASLEASYSMHVIYHRLILSRQHRLRFRVAEIALILVLLKLGSFIGQPWGSVILEASAWGEDPLGLLTLETVAVSSLALMSWGSTTLTLLDMERMHLQPRERVGERNPVNTITGRFFGGGMLLLFSAGLTRIGIASLLGLSQPPTRGLTALVLTYFLLGLTVLGHVQLVRLRERWKSQRIRVESEVTRRWARYSLLAVGLSALLSFLLPTSYSDGILQAAAIVIDFLLRGFLVVARLLVLLVGLLLWLLTSLWASLFGKEAAPPALGGAFPDQIPESLPSSPEWLAPIRAVLFWIIAVGVVFYVVRTYLQDHPGLLRGAFLHKLLRAIVSFFARLRQTGARLRQTVRNGWPLLIGARRRGRLSDGPVLNLSRLRRLTLRERIQAYYLSVVHRAGRYGIPRRRAQTPFEYREALSKWLPDAREQLAELTEAFILARYSTHPVGKSDVRSARSLWRRLRTALRTMRMPKPAKAETEQ